MRNDERETSAGRLAIAAGGLFGVLAAARDSLLRGGDLTSDLAGVVTQVAMAAVVYTVMGAVLVWLLALVFSPVRETPDRDLAHSTWWFASAGMVLAALSIPVDPAVSSVHVLAYAAMLTLAVLAARSLHGAADGSAGIAGRVAGTLAGGVTAFVGARAVDSERLPSGLLGLAIVVVAAVVAAFVAGWVLSAAFGALAQRTGDRRVAAGALSIVAALVLLPAAAGFVGALDRQTLQDDLSRLHDVGDPDRKRPSVILISVDTLRADYVGYAGGEPRTPTMDALAEESWVFENAYSVAPWTRSSFASFFTSKYPSEVGVARARGMGGRLQDTIPFTWVDDRPGLVELFEAQGYGTGAVVTNPNLTAPAGAARGFHAFHHCSDRMMRRARPHDLGYAMVSGLAAIGIPRPDADEFERASVVTARGSALIEALGTTNVPVVAWLHYMDPHHPYDAPQAEQAHVQNMSVQGASERERVVDAYVAEVEYFDTWLQTVIERLRESGLWDRSIVVLWSDHGEEFWEHRGWAHAHTLYDELMHVPLLIHLPGQSEMRRISETVSLLDLAPTLLELCEIDASREMRGRSFAPLLEGETTRVEEGSFFLEGCAKGGIQKGLVDGRMKLIHDLYSDSYELYDLEEDPGEHTNLFGTGLVAEQEQMRRRLDEFTESSLSMMEEHMRTGRREDIDEETLERLRDMGYIQ